MPIRQLVIAFAVLSLALVVGCDRAPTHESVMEQQVTTMEDVAKLLTTVTDEASANSAKPKLKELSEKLKAVKAEADKIAKPTKEKEDELRKKYEEPHHQGDVCLAHGDGANWPRSQAAICSVGSGPWQIVDWIRSRA